MGLFGPPSDDDHADLLGFGTPKKRKRKKTTRKTKTKKRDSRRSFTRTQKNEILYQQDNKCAKCHKKLDPRATEFDHKKPWAAGGRTVTVNGRALCANCHKIVTHKTRLKQVDKKRKATKRKPAKKRRTRKPKNPFDVPMPTFRL